MKLLILSTKRSCIHMAQTNGQLIPFDTFNIFYRDGAAGAHLVAKAGVSHE
jgi:7,8-dihydro-6-hydroxymethylpterin dimethyltransferase